MDVISTRRTVFKLLASFLGKKNLLNRYIEAVKREAMHGTHLQDRRMRDYLQENPKASKKQILMKTIEVVTIRNSYSSLICCVFDWDTEEEINAEANGVPFDEVNETWAPLNEDWELIIAELGIDESDESYDEEDDWI